MLLLVLIGIACLSSPVASFIVSSLGFQCEAQAQVCAAGKTDAISNNLKKFYFQTSCKMYKEGLECLYRLQNKDANCKVINHATAFQKAKSDLFDATSGLCGVDGSVDGCAYGFINCMRHVDNIKDKSNNETCSEYIKMSDCVELLQDRKLCPVWIETHLSDTLSKLKAELQMECFRTCELALDLCVANVPLDLTLNPTLKEGEQEVLCAEIETAMDCINATDVEGLCEDEKETPKWEEALQNQTSYYKSFCSVPAKTCSVQLRDCSTDVEAMVAAGISTPQDVAELCQEVENALDCVNRTSVSGFCQGKTGARMLARILNEHRHELDTYCDPAVVQRRRQTVDPAGPLPVQGR
ncbi:hypothetical protein RRG08_001799 [Elysia crispata]|uniref:Secreted protein n=1 Tax=Elysia crispata TaxID=231223 RepID=A0AAE1ANW3_9GAST|nr:hypothetical protein RRG08_001799 [Elysia crispata]